MKKSWFHYIFDIFVFAILVPGLLILFFYQVLKTFPNTNSIAIFSVLSKFNEQTLFLFICCLIFCALLQLTLVYTVNIGVERMLISENGSKQIISYIGKFVLSLLIILCISICLDENQFAFFTGLIGLFSITLNLFNKKQNKEN